MTDQLAGLDRGYVAAIDDFTREAKGFMDERLTEGVFRGWGLSWRDGTYYDIEVLARLRRAVDHLEAALRNTEDPDEWRKRAADVANQAFMAADPERRRAITRRFRTTNEQAVTYS